MKDLVRRMKVSEIKVLARQVVTNERFLAWGNDEDAIRSAFYLILPFVKMTRPQVQAVGALVGDYADRVPGRGMNGYPIFTSVRFVHREDCVRLATEIARYIDLLNT